MQLHLSSIRNTRKYGRVVRIGVYCVLRFKSVSQL